MSKADVTGRGYRCNACSMKASLAADTGYNDIPDHLTQDERSARFATAGKEMVAGAAMTVGGLFVFLLISSLIGGVATLAGVGMVSHGFLTRREMTGQRTH